MAELSAKPAAAKQASDPYDAWSKTYDATFGRLVHKRQTRAIAELGCEPGMRVLDLGVGTGLSMSKYPNSCRVVGVDLSGGMLRQAKSNLEQAGHDARGLIQGDALRTPFADGAFDRVMVSHVISVVSDPAALLRECRRVVKPDGRIVVLNHFQSPSRVVGFCEKVLNPVFVRLGWRSDLTLHECLAGQGLQVLYHFKLSAVDFWQVLVLSPTPVGLIPASDRPEN
ncbi:MAG: methyltransferase domain-containing protein [Planctomycetota bacterium]